MKFKMILKAHLNLYLINASQKLDHAYQLILELYAKAFTKYFFLQVTGEDQLVSTNRTASALFRSKINDALLEMPSA